MKRTEVYGTDSMIVIVCTMIRIVLVQRCSRWRGIHRLVHLMRFVSCQSYSQCTGRKNDERSRGFWYYYCCMYTGLKLQQVARVSNHWEQVMRPVTVWYYHNSAQQDSKNDGIHERSPADRAQGFHRGWKAFHTTAALLYFVASVYGEALARVSASTSHYHSIKCCCTSSFALGTRTPGGYGKGTFTGCYHSTPINK